MILIGVIATTTLISLAHCTPLSYTTYQRRELPALDRPELVLLFDPRDSGLENEMFGSGNDPRSAAIRNKRIGSLSINNSVDVLRQRVLLELARRKAMQDQYQIDENRRMMQTVGKRSNSDSVTGYPTSSNKESNSGIYLIEERPNDRDQSQSPVRISDRTASVWLEGNDHDHDHDQDQTRRVQTNEVHLL
ncbi:diuretic hormone 44 [Belonocnema kinseyi]|uniref:diuretic hormone 44 n=1 Tax=Belonocnema kinseyi TaxID=2817044 RepID=UPI00143D6FBC|nr:diuretic hormone 44 [Belonocnema kinseyi]XP_033225165.1 diuretic hormone 44 [Belonocnema kinseyi]XP_033225166.1 diuretic hormone 44 [Belonocnema kinseyi]